jgi:F-type H+-transporting ATPase subunit b
LKEADEIVASARSDAKAIRERAAEELRQSLQRRSQQAQGEIVRAEAEAVRDIRHQLVSMAEATAREMIRARVKEQGDPSVDVAIDAISRQIH